MVCGLDLHLGLCTVVCGRDLHLGLCTVVCGRDLQAESLMDLMHINEPGINLMPRHKYCQILRILFTVSRVFRWKSSPEEERSVNSIKETDESENEQHNHGRRGGGETRG